MYKLDLGPEPAELTIKHLLQSLAQIEFSMLESRVVVQNHSGLVSILKIRSLESQASPQTYSITESKYVFSQDPEVIQMHKNQTHRNREQIGG